MTVFLIPNLRKQRAFGVAVRAIRILTDGGANIVMEETLKENFGGHAITFLSEQEAFSACDVIVTLGGDGTILQTARRGIDYGKPILGINVGRLGFLATVEADELDCLGRLIRGEYTLDRRSMLSVKIGPMCTKPHMALNEVVVAKASISQTIDLSIYCDDALVSRYAGDGVIIATPTGSTAYSLSAGGPVLDARIDGIVVTPLCAHSMHAPPMVFSAQRRLRVVVSGERGGDVVYSCDGQAASTLTPHETVEVALSDQYMTLISLREAEQFEAIDKKLKGR